MNKGSDYDKYFILTDDLDMGNKEWTPIGNGDRKPVSSIVFSGTFDGNGHTISNLKCTIFSSPDSSNEDVLESTAGLFGILSGAEVKNLTLKDVTVSGENNAGALAGYVTNGSIISNVNVVNGTVSGYTGIGGIAGRLYGGTITDCSNSATVTGTIPDASTAAGTPDIYTHVGGIVGLVSSVNSTVEFCLNTGSVNADAGNYQAATEVNAGGIAGSLKTQSSTVSYCMNSGSVKSSGTESNNNAGGISGFITSGKITGCYDARNDSSAQSLTGKGDSSKVSYSFFNGDANTTPESGISSIGNNKAVTFSNNSAAFGIPTSLIEDTVVAVFEDMDSGEIVKIGCNANSVKVHGFGNDVPSLEITDAENVKVSGCVFNDAENNAAICVRAGGAVTISHNEIDGKHHKGVEIRHCDTDSIIIEFNSISDTTHNAIQITEGSHQSIKISGNRISEWDSDNDNANANDKCGRAIRIDSYSQNTVLFVVGNGFDKDYKEGTVYDYANIVKATVGKTGAYGSIQMFENTFGGESITDISETSPKAVWVDHDLAFTNDDGNTELTVGDGVKYYVSGDLTVNGTLTIAKDAMFVNNGTVSNGANGNIVNNGTIENGENGKIALHISSGEALTGFLGGSIAGDGTTEINLAAGDYKIQLFIENTNNLTIAGIGTVKIIGPESYADIEKIVKLSGEANDYSGLVAIKDSKVTLKNLRIIGDAIKATNEPSLTHESRYCGIAVVDSDVDVIGCYINRVNYNGHMNEMQNGFGIYAVSSDSSNLTVKGTEFVNFNKCAIVVRSNVSLTVENSTITGYGSNSTIGQNGIQFDGPATIKGNSISNLNYVADNSYKYCSVGIYDVGTKRNNVTVQGNTFSKVNNPTSSSAGNFDSLTVFFEDSSITQATSTKGETVIESGVTLTLSAAYTVADGHKLVVRGTLNVGNGSVVNNGTVNVFGTVSGTVSGTVQYGVTFELNPKDSTLTVMKGTETMKVDSGSSYILGQGEYTYTVSKTGYASKSETFTMDGISSKVVSVSLVQTAPPDSGGSETVTNPDGSVTEKETSTVTNPDGSKTEKKTENTTNTDGSKTEKEQSVTVGTDGSKTEKSSERTKDPDGNITGSVEKVKMEDKSTGVSTEAVKNTDSNGNTVSESRTNIPAVTDKDNGNAVTSVTADSLAKAVEHVKSVSDTGTKAVIVIDGTALTPEGVNGAKVSIPVSSVKSVLGDTSAEISVKTDIGNITLSRDVLNSMSGNDGESMDIAVKNVRSDELTDAQKAKAGNNPVFNFSAAVGDRNMHDLGGKVGITLPYELAEGQDPNSVKVFYLDDNGNVKKFDCKYDRSSKTVSFETDHFSYFVLTQDDLSGNSSNTLMIVALVILAIIAAAAVVLFVRSRQGSKQ